MQKNGKKKYFEFITSPPPNLPMFMSEMHGLKIEKVEMVKFHWSSDLNNIRGFWKNMLPQLKFIPVEMREEFLNDFVEACGSGLYDENGFVLWSTDVLFFCAFKPKQKIKKTF